MDPIIIENYSPEWPELFNQIGSQLRNELKDVAIRIDHIGSTSIPGMASKPVIDLQISVKHLDPISQYKNSLERCGFFFRENNPELTKRYFRESPGERRTHIHVRKEGSWHQQFPLLFRDYLRENDSDARLYESEKLLLANMYMNDRIAYIEGKNKIFWEIIYRADRWAAINGWEPSKTDA